MTGGSALAFWALVSFTIVLLVAPQTMVPSLAVMRPALLAVVAAAVAYSLDCLKRHRAPLPRNREILVAGALVLWAIVTIPFSVWPGGSVAVLLDLYMKSVVIFCLLAGVVDTVGKLRRIAWTLVLCSAPVALAGLVQYHRGELVAGDDFQRIAGYASPLANNPNDTALLMNQVIPFGLALLQSARSRLARGVVMALLVLMGAAIFITLSRGGLITFVVLMLIYVPRLVRRRGRGPVIGLLLVAVLGLPLLPSSFWDRMGTIGFADAEKAGTSSQIRQEAAVLAIELAVRNPITGVGIGQDPVAINGLQPRIWTGAHNAYLQYVVDLGVPGLVLFLMLLIGCVRAASMVRRGCRREPRLRELGIFAEAIQVSLIAYAVSAPFHPIAYHFNFYYMAGLALAARLIYANATRGMSPRSAPRVAT